MDKYLEEIQQSRQAAEEIAESASRRRRAEEMARASGGVSAGEALFYRWSPSGILSAWAGKEPRKVKSGELTPKQYRELRNRTNYTGMVKNLKKNAELSAMREILGTNEYSTDAEDDFVSAWFNDHTPMREYGVAPIRKETLPMYRKVFPTNHPDLVTEEGFRGYQVRPETLDFAADLDSLANRGELSHSPVEENVNGIWQVGDTDAAYDAKNHTKISVDFGGRKYSKNVDVFDVKNLNRKVPVVGKAVEFINSETRPYFVSTPWYEDND